VVGLSYDPGEVSDPKYRDHGPGTAGVLACPRRK